MKIASFFAVIVLSAATLFAQQWQTISSGVSGNLNKIVFYSHDLGMVVGNDGALLRTNDGGASWQSISNTQDVDFNDVQFLSANTIVAVGERHWNQPAVAISYDGGNTWWMPVSPANIPSGITSVYFLNASIGYATAGGYVLKTADGGLTWTATQATQDYHLTHVHFTDAQHGVVSGGQHDMTGFTMHTNDGGATWVYDNDSYVEPITSTQTLDSQTEWRIGGDFEFGAYLSHTVDGGATWSQLVIPAVTNAMTDLHFFDAQHGVAVGGQYLLRTNDGGATWSQSIILPEGNINAMTIDNNGNTWVVGSNGTIMRSTSVTSVSEGTPVASFSLGQNYPNPVANSTQFDFTLPSSSQATLRIYSVDGKEVKTLLSSSTLDAGAHSFQWDGTNNAGTRVVSGTYIYKLTVGEQTLSKRLTVLQ